MAKPLENNPRIISEAEKQDLANWLAELGDLSGIVHDLNSDQIITGNQRSDVFDINECEIFIAQELDEPDKQGTVALGYVVWRGFKYNYRQVRWTARQCQKASVISNQAGGHWDWEKLLLGYDKNDLAEWGFDDGELAEALEAIETAVVGDASDSQTERRDMGDKAKQIRPVLYMEQVDLLERAIKKAGLRNRGEAVAAICRAYLGENDTERQLYLQFESAVATEFA